jgi:hypothetical protein
MDITHIEAASYTVLVDRQQPVIGLRVNPILGSSFIIPMPAGTAREIGTLLTMAAQI